MKDITLSEIYELIDLNQKDKEISDNIMEAQQQESHNPYPMGFNRFDFYRHYLSSMHKDGFIMEYPHATVIRQAQRSFYYRGENKLFPTTKSTLARYLNSIKDKKDRLFYEFIHYLQLLEFSRLPNTFKHTKKFEELGITILYEQIAQHYGIKTRWLDITNDFDVALFFACCKFENNTWQPLTKSDFNCTEKAKYGVLFKKPTDPITNYLPSEINQFEILPVGYQPFMRCSMQTSYSIFMDDKMDLKKSDFEVFKFQHSEHLSKFIFDKMDKGNKIFPYEGLNPVIEQVELIINSQEFSKEVFDETCNEFKELSASEWEAALHKKGYRIGESPINLTKDAIQQINELYKNFQIEEFYNINLSYWLTYQNPDTSIK